MRNKYNKNFENYVRDNALNLTKEELRKKIEKTFNITMTKRSLETYLYRHSIKCIDYDKTKVRDMPKCKIGYEYVKDDGMILVKIAQPCKWEYKQRLMYQKYHKCKLTNDDYIIFLNHNRNDFSKDNLVKITRKESSILSNQKMFSSNKNLTKLGILTAKLMIKVKEKEKC